MAKDTNTKAVPAEEVPVAIVASTPPVKTVPEKFRDAMGSVHSGINDLIAATNSAKKAVQGIEAMLADEYGKAALLHRYPEIDLTLERLRIVAAA